MEGSPAYLGNLAYLPMSSSPLVDSIEDISATVEAPPPRTVKTVVMEPSIVLVSGGATKLNTTKPINAPATSTAG